MAVNLQVKCRDHWTNDIYLWFKYQQWIIHTSQKDTGSLYFMEESWSVILYAKIFWNINFLFEDKKTGKDILNNTGHRITTDILWSLLRLLKNRNNELQMKISHIEFQQNVWVYGACEKLYYALT